MNKKRKIRPHLDKRSLAWQTATQHCLIHGHNLVNYLRGREFACNKCGLSISEIRRTAAK